MRTRKFLLCFLLIAVFIWSNSIPAYASEVPGVISPRLTYIARASCNLNITSGGQAYVDGSITGYSSLVNRVSITAELQRSVNNQWVTINTWTKSADNYWLTLSESMQVSKGYNYRAVVTVTAYSGSNSESQTLTSGQVYY